MIIKRIVLLCGCDRGFSYCKEAVRLWDEATAIYLQVKNRTEEIGSNIKRLYEDIISILRKSRLHHNDAKTQHYNAEKGSHCL